METERISVKNMFKYMKGNNDTNTFRIVLGYITYFLTELITLPYAIYKTVDFVRTIDYYIWGENEYDLDDNELKDAISVYISNQYLAKIFGKVSNVNVFECCRHFIALEET